MFLRTSVEFLAVQKKKLPSKKFWKPLETGEHIEAQPPCETLLFLVGELFLSVCLVFKAGLQVLRVDTMHRGSCNFGLALSLFFRRGGWWGLLVEILSMLCSYRWSALGWGIASNFPGFHVVSRKYRWDGGLSCLKFAALSPTSRRKGLREGGRGVYRTWFLHIETYRKIWGHHDGSLAVAHNTGPPRPPTLALVLQLLAFWAVWSRAAPQRSWSGLS